MNPIEPEDPEYLAAIRRNHQWLRDSVLLSITGPKKTQGPKHHPLPPKQPPAQKIPGESRSGSSKPPKEPKPKAVIRPVFAISGAEIYRRLVAGETDEQIAAAEGCSIQLLEKRLYTAGLKRPPRPCLDCGETTGRASSAARCARCQRNHMLENKRVGWRKNRDAARDAANLRAAGVAVGSG